MQQSSEDGIHNLADTLLAGGNTPAPPAEEKKPSSVAVVDLTESKAYEEPGDSFTIAPAPEGEEPTEEEESVDSTAEAPADKYSQDNPEPDVTAPTLLTPTVNRQIDRYPDTVQRGPRQCAWFVLPEDQDNYNNWMADAHGKNGNPNKFILQELNQLHDGKCHMTVQYCEITYLPLP